MALSQTDLTRIALDITSGLAHRDRFSRLLNTVRENLHCDAAALLTFHGQYFTPLAIDGLNDDVLGRRFILNEHPRLEAIARAGDIVRFPADSELADPYDGLIPNQTGALKVHACIGLPLFADEQLIGAVTIDAFNPLQFDQFSNAELRSLSAIAAASLSNALLVEKLERMALNSHSTHAQENSPNLSQNAEIIGHSPLMQSLNREIGVVAHSDLNVLILGETGTGKELVAQAIHQKSARSSKPLVYLNCAALPESVAESELFGHIKGAFTGAISHRSGKFEMADKGTLFLDEIGELPLTLQAKLLRVLQYGDIQKVGDDRSLKVDVRIIAATNKDLKTEVLAGRFRADLYHRLSVFPILVPPLREREQDITLLSGFFAERYRQKLGMKQLNFSNSSLLLLNQYTWPGNVRELEHAIHRATVLARVTAQDGCCTIAPQHFDLPVTRNTSKMSSLATTPLSNATQIQQEFVSLSLATDTFQRDYIKQVFTTHTGNWAATARTLGVDPGNLHRLAKRLKLK
ncbi:nitric oxide reductase transcription regulator [Shewanella xiamenensis]|uniref:nitric oxide reductase transcriptional regulator NorR n=1 Tax=Shewanella xiamenensis TaxID=332186 RepID=UPI001184CA67|nr:nitric oxide reductase transcriptional regulator NorR [Shewanella xiamenensis]TVL20795.1 nitric oxide reductase transcription regulator [Shewanella xiamenensis]TVL20906.1 nitric oxide reductase transcription regulator [Shewanella xiamenensis]TVL27120.1 nitric oxide reductase transcription regulator [Shewanella xiamenensis]TVL34385.1 nitric oxide reductase transcription regulator [Shewanella xiamenensis]TVP03341.1 nitric oxide reductase transcription regulator [Shewanella xiamenensis]